MMTYTPFSSFFPYTTLFRSKSGFGQWMVERQYRGKIVIGAKTEPVIAVASTGGVMVINAAFYLIGISQRSATGQGQTKCDQNSCRSEERRVGKEWRSR